MLALTYHVVHAANCGVAHLVVGALGVLVGENDATVWRWQDQRPLVSLGSVRNPGG